MESLEDTPNPTVDAKQHSHIILNKRLDCLNTIRKEGVTESRATVSNTLGSFAPNEEVVVLAERKEDGGKLSEGIVGSLLV